MNIFLRCAVVVFLMFFGDQLLACAKRFSGMDRDKINRLYDQEKYDVEASFGRSVHLSDHPVVDTNPQGSGTFERVIKVHDGSTETRRLVADTHLHYTERNGAITFYVQSGIRKIGFSKLMFFYLLMNRPNVTQMYTHLQETNLLAFKLAYTLDVEGQELVSLVERNEKSQRGVEVTRDLYEESQELFLYEMEIPDGKQSDFADQRQRLLEAYMKTPVGKVGGQAGFNKISLIVVSEDDVFVQALYGEPLPGNEIRVIRSTSSSKGTIFNEINPDGHLVFLPSFKIPEFFGGD